MEDDKIKGIIIVTVIIVLLAALAKVLFAVFS